MLRNEWQRTKIDSIKKHKHVHEQLLTKIQMFTNTCAIEPEFLAAFTNEYITVCSGK